MTGPGREPVEDAVIEYGVVKDLVTEDSVIKDERRINRRGVLSTLGLLLVLGLVMYVAMGPFRGGFGGDLVWPGAAVAIGSLDGADVVVVAYETLGPSEVAAYDTRTGERLWRRSAELKPRPLAAGTEHVVVRDDHQLSILDLRDGSVVAEGTDVAGLDLPHGELNWWQDGDAVDPTEGVVYVSVHDGFPEERPDLVRAVPVDGTSAGPLTARQAKRWGCYVESIDAVSEQDLEPSPRIAAGGVTYEMVAPPGKPEGTPRRQLLVDGAPRGAVYPVGTDSAGLLAGSVSGVVVPDVCDFEWPRSATSALAPGSGTVAALVGMDVGNDQSRLVLLDARTGAELHRVDGVSRVATARTTSSGGAVLVVETRQPALLGLTERIEARVVFISPDGDVTETTV